MTLSRHTLKEFEEIAERYETLDLLGSGGFGSVYKARQLSTGQFVAIKVLHKDLVHSTQSPSPLDAAAALEASRFEREMKTIAELRHPNVVQLLDAGKLSDGRLFVVLEYIQGEELADALKREGALSLKETLRLMSQVLDALSSAHRIGVVHRDLKPQNIMLTGGSARRNAKILDFGIAAIMEEARPADYQTLTGAGHLHGTPSYMAPEQLMGQTGSPQLDIYAWGLTFLECLTGQRVVTGGSIPAIIMTQASPEPIPLPAQIRTQPIGRVLAKAVAKNPEERYRTAKALLEDLEECEGNSPSAGPLELHTPNGIETAVTASGIVPLSSRDDELGQDEGLAFGFRSLPGTEAARSEPPRVPALATPSTPRFARAPTSQATVGSQGRAPSTGRLSPVILGAVLALLVGIGIVGWLFLAKEQKAATTQTETRPTTATGQSPGGADVGSSVADTESRQDLEPTPDLNAQVPVAGEADGSGEVESKAAPVVGPARVEGTRGGLMARHEAEKFLMGADGETLRKQRALCAEELNVRLCEKYFGEQTPTVVRSVAAFHLDVSEVTNGQYAECVVDGTCEAVDYKECAFMDRAGQFVQSVRSDAAAAMAAADFGGADRPVVCVDRGDADQFCAWAGKRLPNEDEWELAATSGGTTLFPWGDEAATLGERANSADRPLAEAMGWELGQAPILLSWEAEKGDGFAFVAPVGAFEKGRSVQGVDDLSGNVREWVAGTYRAHAGSQPTASAGTRGGSPRATSVPGSERNLIEGDGEGITRGGSWTEYGPWVGGRSRAPFPVETRRSDLGFRCAKDLRGE